MLNSPERFFKEKSTEETRALKVYPLAVYESTWRRKLGKYSRRIGRRSPLREISFKAKIPIGSLHIHSDLSRHLYDLTGKPVSSYQELVNILEPSRQRLDGTFRVDRRVTYDIVALMRERLAEERARLATEANRAPEVSDDSSNFI